MLVLSNVDCVDVNKDAMIQTERFQKPVVFNINIKNLLI